MFQPSKSNGVLVGQAVSPVSAVYDVPRMRIHLILCVFAALSLGCCGVAAGGNEDEIRIRKVLTDQSAAWNRGDAVGWASDFTANADFVNLRGSVITGSSEIAKAIGGAAVFKGTNLTITVRKLTFLSSDVAMIDTNYVITGIAAPIPGLTIENGVLKTLVKYIAVKQDGKWRFSAAQNTAAA